jgi:hypothetical protein
MKICPDDPCGWTEMMKLIGTFYNFADMPENGNCW